MSRILLLLLAALFFAVPARAADGGPRVKNASVGFSGQFRNRHWAPLVVDVENPGPARTALLTAEMDAHIAKQRLVFSRPVILPARSVRRFEFPIRPDAKPKPETEKVQFTKVVQVRLTDGAFGVLSQADAVASPIAEEAFCVLVLDTSMLGYMSLREGTVGPEKRPLVRLATPVKNFPRRAIDLAGFDAIVLGNVGENDFSPMQTQALREWVRGGGQLFVQPAFAPAISPALDEIMPADFFAPQPIETLPSIAGAFVFTNGISFARLVPREGDVFSGTRERPLIISRREGPGRVTTLAFDAGTESFAAWPGSGNFWRELFAQSPQFFHHADRLLARSPNVERMLSSLAGLKVLSRAGLMLYLSGALTLLLGTLAAFRFTRAPEWGWAIALVLAVGGGTAAVFGAAAWKSQPQPALNEIYLATASSGAKAARVQAALGCFSPREAKFSFQLAADNASLAPARSVLTPPEQTSFAFEEKLAITNLAVRADDLRVVFGRAPLAETAAPNVAVRLGADGLSVNVTNTSASRLAGAFLKFNRLVVPLGDLAPGARATRAGVHVNAPEAAEDFVRSTEETQRDQLREVFFPRTAYVLDRTISGDERRFNKLMRGREPLPVLLGWSDQSQFPLEKIEPQAARRALGLWAVEAELDYAPGRIFFPRGVLPLHTRNSAALPFERGEGNFTGPRPVTMVCEFSLPEGCPPIEADEATVSFGFRGSAFVAEAYVGPSDAPVADDAPRLGAPFEKLTASAGAWPIPNPARFINAKSRRVVVVVRVVHSEEGKKIALNPNVNFHTWQVRDLDLELKGTVR